MVATRVSERPHGADRCHTPQQVVAGELEAYLAGFAGGDIYTISLPLLSAGPGCLASWSLWTRWAVLRFLWHMQGSFCWYFTPRAVMLRIMAGMNQRDSNVAKFWRTLLLCTTTGACGSDCRKTGFPQLLFMQVVDISLVVQRPISMVLVWRFPSYAWIRWSMALFCSRAVPCRVAEACSHGPDCSADHCTWTRWPMFLSCLSCWFRSFTVVHIPVATQRLIPMVSLTIPQLPVDTVIDVPLCRWGEFPRGEVSCAPTTRCGQLN